MRSTHLSAPSALLVYFNEASPRDISARAAGEAVKETISTMGMFAFDVRRGDLWYGAYPTSRLI